jgi:hypothetical protein
MTACKARGARGTAQGIRTRRGPHGHRIGAETQELGRFGARPSMPIRTADGWTRHSVEQRALRGPDSKRELKLTF